jgi:hypothetical protein
MVFFVVSDNCAAGQPVLFLLTIPAGQVPAHKSMSRETQQEEGNAEDEDSRGKFLNQEKYSSKDKDREHQKIRDTIVPGDFTSAYVSSLPAHFFAVLISWQQQHGRPTHSFRMNG